MIRGCIFDADGTLLDSMRVWDDLGSRYLLTKGQKPEQNLNQILYPMTMAESSAYLKKNYLPELSEKEIQNGFISLIRTYYEKEVPAKKGAVAFVHELHEKNVPLIVATVTDPDMIRSAFERLEILNCFCAVLDTDSIHSDKRHPDIYLQACRIMHTDIRETAVFEDALEPVITAEKAGFPVCAVEDDSNVSQRNEIQKTADLYIHDFNETEKLKRWFQQ